MDVQELARRILEALEEAAVQGDRSNEDLLVIAKYARELPTEIVDNAFALAIGFVEGSGGDLDHYQEVLIAAEQFADRAGLSRFSAASRSAVRRLLTDSDRPPQGDPSERALVRARYFALARAVGLPISIDMLERETELMTLFPTLWLDIASQELSTDAFLEKLTLLLQSGVFEPSALIPRLKPYVQYHGVAAGQLMLEIACRRLYRQQLYDEAENLIAKANLVLNKGWKLPFGGAAEFLPFPVVTVDDCITAFQGALKKNTAEPIKIVRVFREMVDPILTVSMRDAEELHRDALRSRVFGFLPQHPAFEVIRLTGILDDLRMEDGLGYDWWQDFGPWNEHLPDKAIFLRSSQFKIRDVVEEWNSAIIAAEENDFYPIGSSFRSMTMATKLGFGKQRRFG